jgi:hypothetical protein
MKSVIPSDPEQNTSDFLVDGEEFVVALAAILKGSPDDRTNVVKYLCTGQKTDSIQAALLKKVSIMSILFFSVTFSWVGFIS